METPKWVLPLLEAKFATTRGSNRDTNNYGFFCLDCMGDPLCKSDVSIHHPGHEILQVVKSSHEYAVKVTDMVDRTNCDKIHRFQVNSQDIFFLRSKKLEFKENERVVYGCKVCNHSLKKGSEYCSLACKFKKVNEIVNNKRKIVIQESDDDGRVVKIGKTSETEGENIVKQSSDRKRKGVPTRAA